MSNAIQIKVEELNALPVTKIVENEKVEQKFIQMYNAIWGVETGSQIYYKEVFNFQKVLREKPELAECTKMSLYGCFLDMAVNGLSLDPTGRPHCYLIPRSVKIKCTNRKTENCLKIKQSDGSAKPCSYYGRCFTDDKGGSSYNEKRASVNVTGYGELTMRMRAGQIKYADNPVVVYEGDTFKAELQSGKKVVTYSAAIPRLSTKVIGAFIRIVRIDGSEDYQWLLEGDIQRLKGYSERNNSYWDSNLKRKVPGKANELYSSNSGAIDPGFLENKMIKHAFDAYPKVRTGNYTVMETETETPPVIDYGIVEEGELINEPINDSDIPFGEEKQLNAPESMAPTITEADEEEGF